MVSEISTMATFTQIYYHIVFSTKHRAPVMTKAGRPELCRYLWGVIRNKGCHLYRINAMEDHVHIFSNLHPKVNLAEYIKDMKVSSSVWIKDKGIFRGFTHWQEGYGAFTHSYTEKDRLIEYVKNQEEHHKTENYIDEFKRLLEEAGLKYDPKYLD
jgi:putative transposase